MNALDRFEKTVESLIEGFFSRFFGARFHPADLTRRLRQTMEQQFLFKANGQRWVPQFYVIGLSRVDYAQFQSPQQRQAEEQNLAHYLNQLRHEFQAATYGPIQVEIRLQADLQSGQIDIQTDLNQIRARLQSDS